MTTTSGIGRRRAAALDDGTDAYRRRRREIVDAGAQVFKTRGYRGTSLGDIAKVLGVDRASLYYYIGSKDELFEEVVSEVVEANTVSVERIRDTDIPAPDKLRVVVESLLVSFEENYPFLYVYLQENLRHVEPGRAEWAARMRAVNRRYEVALTAIVQQGIDAGTLRTAAPAHVVAFGVLGMAAWTNRWFDPNSSDVDAATIGRSYADVIVDGLRPR